MVELGKYSTLLVIKEVDFGVILDGEEFGNLLLPKRYVPAGLKVDDEIEVFVYSDSEDRPIATTEKPIATVGEFACLEVVGTTQYGAFLDWGLSKDILVPKREQKTLLEKGKSYVVRIYHDTESNRLAATQKLDRYLDLVQPKYERFEEVDAMIVSTTDLGYKAIVNELHWGVLYHSEVFEKLRRGQMIKAYVSKVREDDKIDLNIHMPGYDKVEGVAKEVLDKMEAEGGYLPINDKSSPEDIYKLFKHSKKTFKKAIGALYREKLIVIEEGGVRLI